MSKIRGQGPSSQDWRLLNWLADCALLALLDLLGRIEVGQLDAHLTAHDRQLVTWVASWDRDTYDALLDLYARIVDSSGNDR